MKFKALAKDLKKRAKASFCIILGGMVFTHLFYAFYFYFLGSIFMTVFNILSIIFCLILFLAFLLKNSEKFLNYAFFEKCIHAFFALVTVGTGSGFEIFIICLAFISHQLAGITKSSKTGTRIFIVFAFMMLIGARFLPYSLDLSFFRIYPESKYLDLIFVFNSIAAFSFATAISLLYISKIKTDEEILKQQNLRLSELASMDSLTHLLNRRAMKNKLAAALETKHNYGVEFTIAIVDVDDFKKINDTFGHDCGDMVLKKVVKAIMDNVRESDYVSRWGGDEILILFNNTSMDGAMSSIKRIHKEISNTTFIYDNEPVAVTITIGVCPSNNYYLYQDIIIEADRRLYSGKHSGKNCIIFESSDSTHHQTGFEEHT